MKTQTPVSVQQVIDILTNCRNTTMLWTQAQGCEQNLKTKMQEVAAYRAAFQTFTDRNPTDEELNKILWN